MSKRHHQAHQQTAHHHPAAPSAACKAGCGNVAKASEPRGAVVVVGGSGGLSDRYREIVEERGLELRHYENRVPNGARHGVGKIAAVIVMVGMVSHALRDQVKNLVGDGAPVVYLRSASVSSLRGAVAALPLGDAAGDTMPHSSAQTRNPRG